MSETRSEAIARWEAEGWLDPDCKGCEVFYATPELPYDVHAPSHRAAEGCESGQKPHCTCEVCW